MTPIPYSLSPRPAWGSPLVVPPFILSPVFCILTFLCKTNPISPPLLCGYLLCPQALITKLHFCRKTKTNPNEPNSNPIFTLHSLLSFVALAKKDGDGGQTQTNPNLYRLGNLGNFETRENLSALGETSPAAMRRGGCKSVANFSVSSVPSVA
jgi:hypothetical protein